jgi:PIN domain nuclease of toxin-antitoxin system
VSAIRNARDHRGGLAIAAVTLYEIALLASRGRIDLQTSVESFLDEVEARFIVKPITGRICAETTRLPDAYPKDPMDRLIGATAIAEGLTLITADATIRKSKALSTIW